MTRIWSSFYSSFFFLSPLFLLLLDERKFLIAILPPVLTHSSQPELSTPSADGTADGPTVIVPLDEEGQIDDALPYSRQIVMFNNVCGRRGVFLRCAHRSGWCFFTSREYPSSVLEHNMHGEGVGINAFTPFHYQSCRRGFITVSASGRLRIAQLRLGKGPDKNGDVEDCCVVRKVSLRSAEDAAHGFEVTPYHVDYHPPSQHFVVASMATRKAITEPVKGLKVPPTEERWRLTLHRAGSWTLSDQVWLDTGEQVLDLKLLSLCRGDDKVSLRQPPLPLSHCFFFFFFDAPNKTQQGPDRKDNQQFGTQHLPRKLYIVMGTGFAKSGEVRLAKPCLLETHCCVAFC